MASFVAAGVAAGVCSSAGVIAVMASAGAHPGENSVSASSLVAGSFAIVLSGASAGVAAVVGDAGVVAVVGRRLSRKVVAVSGSSASFSKYVPPSE